MEITLTTDQETWIKKQVAKGRFPSVEDGVKTVFAFFRHEVDEKLDEFGDLAWAKPYIDEGLAAIERGEVEPWKKGDILKELHTKYPNLAKNEDS